LIGALDPEEARPPALAQGAVALQKALLAPVQRAALCDPARCPARGRSP
jgi:hypothetical protein